MGFSIETGVSVFTVFLQGLLSFFSPCVLPLVPLYIGYLAGGTKTVDEAGNISYKRSRVLINTLFFVLGVSFAFLLLGLGFTAAGRFFSGNRVLFSRIGGVLVILFGLFQLGLFGSKLLQGEHRLPFKLGKLAMNPLVALILGFTFSFAWTPCVGPALASVLLMASSAASMGKGFLLIGIYTIGFILPFLVVGLFTSTVLDFFKKHQKVVKYTVKIGGALMIVMGIMMLTGWMNGITGYLSSFGGGQNGSQTASVSSQTAGENGSTASSGSSASANQAANDLPDAPDFTLVDQNGKTHRLSDYKGKTIFLNFWATWCGPCQREMPDIEKLYKKYGGNAKDLIVLGVANPRTNQAPYNQDVTEPELRQFIAKGGYTYPTVMDLTGDVFEAYGIGSFPTTFMIDKNGKVFGYVPGQLTADIMESIVQQTMSGKRSD